MRIMKVSRVENQQDYKFSRLIDHDRAPFSIYGKHDTFMAYLQVSNCNNQVKDSTFWENFPDKSDDSLKPSADLNSIQDDE